MSSGTALAVNHLRERVEPVEVASTKVVYEPGLMVDAGVS
jgi:hypothetical protein